MPSRSGVMQQIRQVFRDTDRPLSLGDIHKSLPTVPASRISATLCYLLKSRYALREFGANTGQGRRKKVWIYNYSDERFGNVPSIDPMIVLAELADAPAEPVNAEPVNAN